MLVQVWFALALLQHATAFDRAEDLRAMGRLREALLAYQEATLSLPIPRPPTAMRP